MIFVDTSYWVAAALLKDRNHREARLLLEQHPEDQLVTSNHTRGESWTFLNRRAGHRAAAGFLDRIERSPRLQVVHVPEHVEDQALRWLKRHDEREYSFVDATSFLLMRELRIRDSFAFDGDFTAAGFRELRAE